VIGEARRVIGGLFTAVSYGSEIWQQQENRTVTGERQSRRGRSRETAQKQVKGSLGNIKTAF